MIHRLSFLSLAGALCLVPGAPVHAACVPGAESLSCQMSRGRTLEVCAGTEMLTYSFGASDPAEMEISVPFAAAAVTPWPGVGGTIWSSAVFANGDTGYEVWVSQERNDSAPTTAGITVQQGGKDIARLACLPGTIEGDATFFEDVMAARGFCWNSGAGRWQPAGSCG